MNSYVVNLYPVPNDGQAGQTVDVTNAAVSSITTPLDYKTTCCYITITGGDCYVTYDGTAPSTTNGHLLAIPYDRFWSKEATRVAKFKASSGNTAHVVMSQFTY